ncbi:MAG TPA: tripartite tricarboxylate transporter substrate-binding protein [Porticoccaceae bacterium]|nr:tripartite tricarboxylate transporter substrate-binding protein [Porticoccaceae bacterium]|tara:strand:+ start:1246 stop:2214 length:969 start_codon:yes stop_codon:yes gene_type:complete
MMSMRLFWSSIVLIGVLNAVAANGQERIHFLIPGGAGGGWDMTARAVGESLSRSGVIKIASYENLSGGFGGRAIAHLIETAPRQKNTLMVNSGSFTLRYLLNKFPYSYRDLTPIASVIADYGAFVVRIDSPYRKWQDVIDDYRKDYRRVNIAGGSSRGSTDHVVAALAFSKSGLDISRLKYIPYNAGGQAMVGLLSGETQMLSTGLSEAVGLASQGEVRVLAITAPKRLPLFPDVPTLLEQGVDAVFANWRGFFGPPNLSNEEAEVHKQLIRELRGQHNWQKICSERGWSDFHRSGNDFITFLTGQEQKLSELLLDLGLLKN